MSANLIIFVGFIYLYISFDFLINKNYPMSLTFFAYALANLGLYFETSCNIK